ncbi:unnamed protein product [Mytilus edulis]|uniref:Reverse transcriptase domain-containing protein n=1 Tax=Mytilus edulis TaxID=6550 RepID=A0A8S3S606_MYTED|nr:unnamed protein product [Mytilus edulis]
MSELIVRTRDNKPNIIGITKVKPKTNRYKPSTAEYSIPEVGNYKMFEKKIKSDEGGCLLMYVDSNLEATEITIKTEFQENIFIKVKLNQNNKLLVGLIYRTPSNSFKEYNDKLVNLMSEATDMGKNILSKKIITKQDPETRAEYNTVRNQAKTSVNKQKKLFEKGLSENAKRNPKAIWSYIKSKSKTREGIGDLHVDTEDVKSDKTDDNKQKAEILSEYFTSVFTNEPQGNIPEPKHIPLDKKIEELNIGTDLFLKHLQKIKTDKSPGPDNLHPRLLFEVKEGIAEPLGIIFSQSLTQKVVPKDWKSALVSAIFKKGNKSQAKNYRPVSLTSVVCKIMEKIIREHIISYMKENKLFSNKQYGFISGRSTSLQLLEVHVIETSSFLKLIPSTENRHSTRVNSNKIIHQRFKTSLRKNSFSVRIAKLWNKLPDKVTKAPSINSFKNRLDRYWEYEEIYYSDYRAELTGSSIRNNGDNNQLYESGEEEP